LLGSTVGFCWDRPSTLAVGSCWDRPSAFAGIDRKLEKLDDRSRKAIFVGYEVGSKAYQCYDPVDQRVIISRDVVFDEAEQWRWENADNEQANNSEPFIMEYSTEIVRDVMPATPSPTPTPASSPVGEHEPEVDEENLDADHDDAPLRVRAIDDLIGDAEPPGLARRVLNAELNFTSAEEPASFHSAKPPCIFSISRAHLAAWGRSQQKPTVDPSKSRRQELTVDPSKSRWSIPARANG
jgi:hypothetical protein